MSRARASRYPPPGMLGPRAIAWWALRTQTDGVCVEGLANVPRSGPVLLAARHYHHLLDGAVLVRYVPRPVHVVVALDWAADARQRRWMERACAWARWPVILRPATTGARGGYAATEVARYLRTGLRDAAALLREGRVIVVFPEGYPVVDPTATAATPRARDAAGFLPFAAGVQTIVRAAHRGGTATGTDRAANGAGAGGAAPNVPKVPVGFTAPDVPIVPVGFTYEPRGKRWHITARFGAPLAADAEIDVIERAVRELSR